MSPALRSIAVASALTALAACGRQKGFDQLPLRVEQVGETQLSSIVKPPAREGDITWWRTSFPGQVFAAVRTDAPCPREIHTSAGVQFRRDTIDLCFTASPRPEPVPGFACSRETYVKYEIMGMPTDVEPKFAFVGTCR